MLWTKCNTLNEQRVCCFDWTNAQWPPPSSVDSPPENIHPSMAQAYKGLKWLVFIRANNIRCFYLRLRSGAMMVVSSLGTPLKLYIYILYVYSESHMPNIFFLFFPNLFLPVTSSVPGEQILIQLWLCSLGRSQTYNLSLVLKGEIMDRVTIKRP